MKVIAMYLPQYHKVKENDIWWGENFTDWVAAKKAQPLYEGHDQPRIPLDHNCYDLLKKETMEWQAKLMHRYGVDGMCIYHYWFKDGRQILEKPAEHLLAWNDIDMPYCFCWANETWARSWSNVAEKNVWADIYEGEEKGRGILLEQSYGGKKEWQEHFEYLLPFFRDRRYIKFDGKPVFLFYNTSQIEHLKEMAELWEKLAVENGFPGIFLIGARADNHTRNVVDAELHMEPGEANRYASKFMYKNFPVRDYDDVWETILSEIPMRQHTCFGGFVGYDDTPRRGRKGEVVIRATPEKFGAYLAELMAKNEAYGIDAVFINAWNEWGEGMYLEPDERDGFRYLEQINIAKERYKEYVPSYKIQRGHALAQSVQRPLQEREKLESYLNLYDRWMSLHEKNIRLSDCLLKKGYRDIAVYGYGNLGKHLINEAGRTELAVRYVIDRQKVETDEHMRVYEPKDDLPKVDAVIISAAYYADEIIKNLKKNNVTMPLISIEGLIKEAEKL